MSQQVSEFSLPVEFDRRVSGIGLPPKLVLDYKTQYRKVIQIHRPKGKLPLSGRIVPIPASYHDRTVVVLPEKWEKAYKVEGPRLVCKLIEPSFTERIELSKVDGDQAKSLPAITESIHDKSVIFVGQYVRENNNIYRIESISESLSEAISTEDTSLVIPRESGNGVVSLADNEPNKAITKNEGPATVIQKQITFENLHKLKGIDHIIARLKNEVIFRFIDILNGKVSDPRPLGGVLLSGPPGCGKSEIANSVAADLGIHFENIKLGDLASPFVHQFGKNLKACFDRAKNSTNGAVILLDELDAVASRRSGLDHSHDRENVNVLLQLLDSKNRSPEVLVFATTNFLSSLDTAVIRSGRFDTKMAVGPPDQTGRAAILRSKLDEYPIDSDSVNEGVVQNLARQTIGYVGADITALVEKSDTYCNTRARKQGNSTGSLSITKDDMVKALGAVTPLSELKLDIEQPTIQKEELPGSERYVDQICAEAELMFHPEKFRSDIDVKPNQAFLLHGPPGTGKTSIANAVANELNILFRVVDAGELKSKIANETVENINKLFENARLFRPILLFFDEIDSIAQHRRSDEKSWASDSINTLLTQFGDTVDNADMIFVGATNRKDMIDPALLRPGRFGTHIEVGRPDLPSIKKQLGKQLKEVPHRLDETHFESLADSLFKQKRTQSDIADFLNNVKRHLKFTTSEGEKADFSLFKTELEALPTDHD